MNRLSVIITAYNVEPYLPQCIESVLKQSMREIEVILVDDGSTDNSGHICDQYAQKDARIKVIHQENRGMLEARRSGLLESTCKYVTYVDGDDFIAADSYTLAESGMGKDLDAVIFGITRYYNTGDQRIEHVACPEGIYDKEKIKAVIHPVMFWDVVSNRFGIDCSLCNKVMKRDLLMSSFHRFTFCSIDYGEDCAIIYPFLKNIKTAEIRKQSYYYHRQRKKTEVPGYIKDDRYFDKLYTLYCHLRKEFCGEPELLKQIDFFYMYSVSLRKRVYEGYVGEEMQYVFPYDQVEKGERIVLYGAGMVGQAYMAQLRKLKYCEVVLWVDRDYQNCRQGGVSPVEAIQAAEYDKVVIAIQNPGTRASVKKDLVKLGVSQACVIV